ncbi:MAG TPA: hypothetical protein VK960_09280 [Acidimicrobiia bacterium]|nr:hypothetical protein [Acidimicrobiia bacterium]
MRLRRALRDAGVAIIGFALILGISYTLGRAYVPAFPQALGDAALIPSTTVVEGEDEPLTIEEMHAEVAADGYPAVAFLQSQGVLEGRFQLNLEDYREWQDEGVEEGSTLDLDMRYYSGFDPDQPSFTITARGIEVGEIRTDRYTVVVSWEAKTFLAQPGQCAIELLDLRFTTLPPPFGAASSEDRTMPVFLGQAVCEDVNELRTDERISFMVVFDYHPDQFTVFG